MSVLCRQNGYLFNLVTVYHREAELMTEFVCPKTGKIFIICNTVFVYTNKGMLQIRNTKKSEEEELRTKIRPRLTLILSKLNSIEMSVCRLFRKWISSHLLSNQIDTLLADLLVYVALKNDEHTLCGSQINGFYRVLHYIASEIYSNSNYE